MIRTLIISLIGLARVAGAATDIGDYDRELCVTAQRMLINADGAEYADAFSIAIERASAGAFGIEHMTIDAATRVINVPMTTVTVMVDGNGDKLATHVGCKMANRDRVNDVLQLGLSGAPRSCRDVNERTYRRALASLSPEQRSRYHEAGRPLRFVEDYKASAGGEWLPTVVNDFIDPIDGEGGAGYLQVQAPSVQVPWDPADRKWFNGTNHCKLVTLAAMRRWMTGGALTGATILFPRHKAQCTEPSSRSSTVGSCVFYFGPAESMFCQDYSGWGWSPESARAECAIRYANKLEWLSAEKGYSGTGGAFNPSSCITRDSTIESFGTCVFHCNAENESLWHVLSSTPSGLLSEGMARVCDLFMPANR